MKTPMQEHIEWLKKEHEQILKLGSENEILLIEDCIKNAESLLEKEKEVMCEFADEFAIECINFHHEKTMSQEQFFNLTFKTKEK
jgi:hypothetical protein